MTVRMTDTPEKVEVVTSVQRRRRWSAAEKMRMVDESQEPGASVSLVARRHGVNPNQLFTWRRLAAHGALTASVAGEEVVPASEHRALQQQIRELHRLLGKKTLEAELLEGIKAVIAEMPIYGYRRVHAVLRRRAEANGEPPPNHKRVWRVMKAHGLLLARHAGGDERRHDGRAAVTKRNTRWCSDGFEIGCGNGERVPRRLRPRLLRPGGDEFRRHNGRHLRRRRA
jgi:transposase